MDEELIEVVEVETIEEIEIDESTGWVGGDSTRHYSLSGRDEADQHPIAAITGLREELDEIEALKPVYSNEIGAADYYQWLDSVGYDSGYFVKLVPHSSMITKCTGRDILGVTVDVAAYIGGQSKETPRDGTYGLVATSGMVEVRCESSVAEGDYVVCNAYGMACTTDTGYGYKAIARDTKNGVEYVVISLGAQGDQADMLGKHLSRLETRMGNAEIDITAIMNTISNGGSSGGNGGGGGTGGTGGGEIPGDISDRLDNIDDRLDSVSQATNYAIDTANQATADVANIRDDLEQTAIDMESRLNDTENEMKALSEEITPLAEWSDGAGNEGVAGFVAKSNETASAIGTMAEYSDNGMDAVAGMAAYVDANSSQIKHITNYTSDTGDTGAAALIAQVNANKASIDNLAKLEGDGYEGLAGMTAQVDSNTSNVTMVSKRVEGNYEMLETWDESAISSRSEDMVYYVRDTEVYYYYDPDFVNANGTKGAWRSASDPYIAGLPAAIAGVQVQTDANSSRIDQLVSWTGENGSNIAAIRQKADENGSSIQLLCVDIDKYSVGEHSQAYGFTLEQAQDALVEGMIFVPLNDVTEEYDTGEVVDDNPVMLEYNFKKGYSYEWDGSTWVESIGIVASFDTPPSVVDLWYCTADTDDGYKAKTLYQRRNYVDESGNTTERWVAVATLRGNASSRAVSQIRQDSNSIMAEVVNAYGAVSGFGAKLSDTDAKVNSIAAWPTDGGAHNMVVLESKADDNGSYMTLAAVTGESGNYKVTELGGAKIVLNDTSRGSFIEIEADNILLDGETSFVTKDKRDGSTKINGAHIATGTITAGSISAGAIKAEHMTADSIEAIAAKVETATIDTIVSSNYVQDESGLKITLTDGVFDAKNFKIDVDGNVTMAGKVTATSGYIGDSSHGFAIDGSAIRNEYDVPEEIQELAKSHGLTLPSKKMYMGTYNNTYHFDPLFIEAEYECDYPYVYVGADGIGTCHVVGAFDDNGDYNISSAQTWMANGELYSDSATIIGKITATSGWIGNEESGFSISGNAIRNEYDAPDAVKDGSGGLFTKFYMSTHDSLNYTTDMLEHCKIAEYDYSHVYVGTDGVGTYHLKRTVANGISSTQTWIADGKLFSNSAEITGYITATGGWIGSETNGLQIKDNAIRNVRDVSDLAEKYNGTLRDLYMTSYDKLYVSSTLWDFYVKDQNNDNAPINRDYIYIGTSGIGTYHINDASGGSITSASQTWMANGELFSNSATITGKITATSGMIGGIHVISNAICDNDTDVAYSTWGIISSDDYVGYNTLSLADSGALSLDGTSPINFFSGGSGLTNAAASFNTKNTNFYVTQSGLVSARGLLCSDSSDDENDAIIGLQTKCYDAYLNAGQLVFYDKGKINSITTGNTTSVSINSIIWKVTKSDGTTNTSSITSNAAGGTMSLVGTWYGTSAQPITSWRGGKHDIEGIDDRYSTLLDNLRPVRFKYNDGESDRYHTGFILDELKDAMDKANIDSSEFAAYCVNDEQTGEGGIRYSEIIALNTLEIQKLKARVAELENKISNEN